MFGRDTTTRHAAGSPALATALIALVLTLGALGAPAAGAQEETPEPERPAVEQGIASAERAGLAAAIVERYEVLPSRDGVVLRPRSAGTGILSIDVADGVVAIDGEVVGENEARARLGAAADEVLALAEMDAREMRSLLLGIGAGVPPPSEPPGEPLPTPPVPAVEPVPPPLPPELDVGQKLSFGSSVKVEEGEVAEQAVAIGASVTVDGEVATDAVAVGGSVHVDGTVGGEVVAVGGSVFLGSEARVGGQVTSVGGRVHREEGAEVGGEVVEVSLAEGFFGSGGWDIDLGRGRWVRFDEAGDVIGGLVCFVVLLLLVWLVVLIAQRPLARMEARLAADPWRAALAGLLTLILFLPLLAILCLILLISVIGIPLLVLVPVVLLLFAVALLVGYAAVALTVGRWLERRFGWRLASPYMAALVGVTAIEIWTLLGDGLDVFGGPIAVLAALVLAFGFLVSAVAWIVGLGTVVLTRFGAAPRPPAVAAGAPAPPPPPASPPPPPPAGAGGYEPAPPAGSRASEATEPAYRPPPAAPEAEPPAPPGEPELPPRREDDPGRW